MSRKRGPRLKGVDHLLIRRGIPEVERLVESQVVTPPEFDAYAFWAGMAGLSFGLTWLLMRKQESMPRPTSGKERL